MARRMNRLPAQLPVEHMQTYRIWRPDGPSHWRPATCEEARCAHHREGWRSSIDEATQLGQQQAHYIRKLSGRKFTEDRHPVSRLTVFVFEPGQQCFAEHRAALEREPLYVVRGGDWRGNPRGTPARVHANARDWVDDFGEHQQTLADRLAQG